MTESDFRLVLLLGFDQNDQSQDDDEKDETLAYCFPNDQEKSPFKGVCLAARGILDSLCGEKVWGVRVSQNGEKLQLAFAHKQSITLALVVKDAASEELVQGLAGSLLSCLDFAFGPLKSKKLADPEMKPALNRLFAAVRQSMASPSWTLKLWPQMVFQDAALMLPLPPAEAEAVRRLVTPLDEPAPSAAFHFVQRRHALFQRGLVLSSSMQRWTKPTWQLCRALGLFDRRPETCVVITHVVNLAAREDERTSRTVHDEKTSGGASAADGSAAALPDDHRHRHGDATKSEQQNGKTHATQSSSPFHPHHGHHDEQPSPVSSSFPSRPDVKSPPPSPSTGQTDEAAAAARRRLPRSAGLLVLACLGEIVLAVLVQSFDEHLDKDWAALLEGLAVADAAAALRRKIEPRVGALLEGSVVHGAICGTYDGRLSSLRSASAAAKTASHSNGTVSNGHPVQPSGSEGVRLGNGHTNGHANGHTDLGEESDGEEAGGSPMNFRVTVLGDRDGPTLTVGPPLRDQRSHQQRSTANRSGHAGKASGAALGSPRRHSSSSEEPRNAPTDRASAPTTTSASLAHTERYGNLNLRSTATASTTTTSAHSCPGQFSSEEMLRTRGTLPQLSTSQPNGEGRPPPPPPPERGSLRPSVPTPRLLLPPEHVHLLLLHDPATGTVQLLGDVPAPESLPGIWSAFLNCRRRLAFHTMPVAPPPGNSRMCMTLEQINRQSAVEGRRDGGHRLSTADSAPWKYHPELAPLAAVQYVTNRIHLEDAAKTPRPSHGKDTEDEERLLRDTHDDDHHGTHCSGLLLGNGRCIVLVHDSSFDLQSLLGFAG